MKGMLPKNSKKRRPDSYTDLKRKGFKKPRNGEINYFPEIPEGETLDTLNTHKEELQNEYRKRDPNNVILDQKMSLTYYLRRQEIVKFPKKLNEYKKDWPMLFSPKMLQKEMIRLIGIDTLPKLKQNLKNKNLLQIAMKQMPMNAPSDEELLKLLPNIFKEKWSFFIEKVAPDSTSLFSEDLIIEECHLPPHPVIIDTASGWSIMGEGVLLLEDLDFITSVTCLISLYHIFDINYHPLGLKSMLFLSVALAEIPSAQKLPAKVHNLLSKMKLA